MTANRNDLKTSTADRLGGVDSSFFLSAVQSLCCRIPQITYILCFENGKVLANSWGENAETFACAQVSCCFLSGQRAFPDAIDRSAISAMGEQAVIGLYGGCWCRAKIPTFSKRQSMRPSTGTPEHSRLSAERGEVHINSGCMLIARGCWIPNCFFAGGEGPCSCGAHCESHQLWGGFQFHSEDFPKQASLRMGPHHMLDKVFFKIFPCCSGSEA